MYGVYIYKNTGLFIHYKHLKSNCLYIDIEVEHG